MKPAVHIRDLHKGYGSIEAVRGLSLTVEEGEMFGLVGPDGAGKTTTIRVLCGILPPDRGEVSVLGFGLPRDRSLVHEHIGYLSQRFSLYEDLSVDENIAFFAEIHGVRDYRRRRDELLAFTRLEPFRTRLAGKLSGGMRQKLALACTLIHRPRLILLDEPTTGVDPVARRDFWKLLADVRRSGVTMLMSTPYLDEAERCTRVGLLNQGRLMIAGTPDEVRALVPGSIVEMVCGEVHRAGAVLRGTPRADDVQLFGDRLNVLVRDPDRDVPVLLGLLREHGIEVVSRRIVPPSLENAFITLLGAEPGGVATP